MRKNAYTLSQKKSGIWFVDFDDDGQRRRLSTKTRDKTEAHKKARDLVLGTGNTPGSVTSSRGHSSAMVTMNDLFVRCEKTIWHPRELASQRTLKSNLKVLTKLIGDEPVATMDYSRLERLKDDLFALDYAPGTVKRKMDTVGKALTMACRWTDANGKPLLRGKPPMPSITCNNARDRVLTPAEERAVFKAIEVRQQSEPTREWWRYGRLIRFLLDTGCRLGEALVVTEKSVEMHPDGITYVALKRHQTKTRQPRLIPLTDAVLESLPKLTAMADGGPLFPFKQSAAWYRWSNIRKDVQAMPNGHDISDVVLHSMRHTCLTALAKENDVLKVSRWAGHSNISTTAKHYAHLSGKDLHGALDVLNRRAQQG